MTLTGDKPACNISLVASCPSFIHVAPRNVVIQRVGGIGQQSTPVMVKLYLYALKTHLPTGNIQHHTTHYTTPLHFFDLGITTQHSITQHYLTSHTTTSHYTTLHY